VTSDANLKPDSTIADVVKMLETIGHSTMPVTDDGTPNGKLMGILTSRDYRLNKCAPTDPVSKYMTPFDKLVYGEEGITLSDANETIWDHKLNCLPIIDKDKRLVAVVFRKDYDDHKENPDE